MKLGLLRRKFGKVLVLVCIVFIICVVSYSTIIRFFSIQTIQVVGSDILVIVDQNRISKNLLFFPSEKFRSEILRDNPLLLDVRFEKVFPQTLKIIPVMRSPVARLLSENRMILIDREGVILQDGDQGLQLPLLVINLLPFRVGEILRDNRVQLLLTFVAGAGESFPIVSITEYDSWYYLVKTAKTDIYITQDKPIGETMATLQTLMSGFRIKGTLPAVVDLRFDKPIIKY